METFEKFYNTYLSEPLTGTSKNRVTTCPFCEREEKFSVDITSGMGRCLSASCDIHVNAISFLTKFHAAWLDYTEDADYARLAKERGISVITFKQAKFAFDQYSNRWLVPYKNPFSTQLTNLGYFYERGKNAFKIFKAPNTNDAFPLTLYNPYQKLKNPSTKAAKIIEGEWDTLAMMDLTRSAQDPSPIVGLPGALFFPETCKAWFGKFDHLDLFLDNDEAGELGKIKVANQLHSWQKSVHAVEWSAVPDAPENYDVRDMLINRNGTAYNELITSLCPVEPLEDEEELSQGYVASISDISEVPDFDRYLEDYSGKGRKWKFHLTETNKRAIAITTAIATCQYMHGEMIWAFLVGQAGSGKTTLIESYGGRNELYDYASRITSKSLVSGWTQGNDPSILTAMNGKTFFIKDFTVVLGMPKEQKREVFNLFRDIYDGTLKITFGNGKVCDFHNLRFNMVAGVTDAIKSENDSLMGERFLRIDYMGDEADDENIIRSALTGFGRTDERKVDMTNATLGYVKTILRQENMWNIQKLPMLSDDSVSYLTNLARYTAYVRARSKQDRQNGLVYRPRKEIAGRLALQYAKLAFSLEKVYNPSLRAGKVLDLSDRVLSDVAKAARDTAEGFNQEVIHALHDRPKLGRKDLESKLHLQATRIHQVITDLKAVGLINTVTSLGEHRPQIPFKSKDKPGVGRPSEYYYINPDFQPIMNNLFPKEEA